MGRLGGVERENRDARPRRRDGRRRDTHTLGGRAVVQCAGERVDSRGDPLDADLAPQCLIFL